MSADDERWMRRAIAAARPNLGQTGDLPVVGCVLVKDGRVVGENATAEGGSGSLHAEERALDQAGEDARGAVAYVTLEPCGERRSARPSCSERLVQAGVARVVVACEDASPLASGRGLERLRLAGVPVEVGLLSAEASSLYTRYAHRRSPPASS